MDINVDIKKSYNFRFYSSGILGIGHDNATVMSVMDYETAKSISDVTSLHAQAYSGLPAGTPKNPADLIYVKIRLSTGEIRVIAKEWLSQQPVQSTSTSLKVTVYDTSVSDIPTIREILLANGYAKFEITSI